MSNDGSAKLQAVDMIIEARSNDSWNRFRGLRFEINIGLCSPDM